VDFLQLVAEKTEEGFPGNPEGFLLRKPLFLNGRIISAPTVIAMTPAVTKASLVQREVSPKVTEGL